MRQKKFTINNEDRKDWVRNDEGLYHEWLLSRMSLTTYVREHRHELDAYIRKVTGQEESE
jgi:hypothetical protein